MILFNRVLLVLLFSFITYLTQAQHQTGFHYKIKNIYKPVYIRDTVTFCKSRKFEPTLYYKDTASIKEVPKKKLKAKVVQDTKNPKKINVVFWSIPVGASYNKKNHTKLVNSEDKPDLFYYIIKERTSLGIPDKYISLPYATWEIGVATIPFKYRFGYVEDTLNVPNDASASFNAGIYVGRKWGRSRFFIDTTRNKNLTSFTLAAFFSPTVIAITKTNTRPIAERESNELGASVGFGLLYSVNNINFGFFSGIDIPFSSPANRWNYAYKPWIGFGIGYKLGMLGDK